MVRHHISANPVVVVEARQQTGRFMDGMKPNGLWYEVDGGWRSWCESEMPHWIDGRRLFRVELRDERIFKITNSRELHDFHKLFHLPLDHNFRIGGNEHGIPYSHK